MSNLPTRTVPFGLGQKVSYDLARSILNGTIRELTADLTRNVTSVGAYQFRYNQNLVRADYPDAVSIGDYAFQSCGYLGTVNFPNVTSIGVGAFNNSGNYGSPLLTTVNFPKVTNCSKEVFSSCITLAEASFPKMTSCGQAVFYNCTQLRSLLLPELTMCNCIFGTSYAASRKVPLTTLTLPKVVTITSKTFGRAANQQLTAIVDLYLPHKTIAQVKAMSDYATWYLSPDCTIHASDGDFLYNS